jgi:molybdopterin synthase catalytic subunit
MPAHCTERPAAHGFATGVRSPFGMPRDDRASLQGRPYNGFVLAPPANGDWIGITHDPLPVDTATAWVTTPASGGVVCFLGIVRDHSEGRDGVVALTYEAYEEQATRALADVAAAARNRWTTVERIALLHRIGDLALSEASVAVVVAAPHRAEAFEVARFCIDTLKETVPIWKREHWDGGSDWAVCDHPVRSVSSDTLS